MMKRLICVVAIAVAWAATADASLINVNFDGTYTGQAATGASGDYWNSTSDASGASVALKDATGSDITGLTMACSGVGAYNVGGNSPFGSESLAGLMAGYVYAHEWNGTTFNDTSLKVTLSGLAAGKYDLYLYSASNDNSRIVTFAANGGSTTIGPNMNSAGTAYSTLINGANYGVVEVTVGSDGVLAITSTAVSGESDLCGFQLKSVPEPTSMVMLIGGGLCLVAYAWRKRRSM